MKLRLTKLVPFLCLAATTAITMNASAASTVGGGGTVVSYNYTYVFNLDGGTFTMTVDGGPFGSASSTGIGYFSYGATPLTGGVAYTPDGTLLTSGNTAYDSNGQSLGYEDIEVVLQYDNTTTGYGNTLDYTIAEPETFWATGGTQSLAQDGNTLYDVTNWVGPVDTDADLTANQRFGTIPEGADYEFYDNGQGTDPACSVGCGVTTTITPVYGSVTPEPSSLALLSTGVLGALSMVRRRRNQK